MGKHAVEDQRDDMPIFIHSELDDFGLNPFEFRAYAHLARRIGKRGGEYWESLKEGAAVCHMDVKTYRAALSSLEAHGLISREDRLGQTSIYRLAPKGAWRTPTTSGRATTSGRGAENGTTTPTKNGGGTPTKSGTQRYSQEGNPLEGNPPSSARAVEAPAVTPPDDDDLTPHQRWKKNKPPDRLHESRLASHHPGVWDALTELGRVCKVQGTPIIAAWSRKVCELLDAHGDAAVTEALQRTSLKPNVDDRFAYFLKVITSPKRAAKGEPDYREVTAAEFLEGSWN